jgi:hypothetical protein
VNKLSTITIKYLLIVIVLAAGIFSIRTLSLTLTYAQTPPSSSSSADIGAGAASGGNMKKTTSGGALDILLQPSPQPVGHTAPTSFKVSFLQKGTDTVQPHRL